MDMSLATILLYLADCDALASAKRHTCSAWRKELAIGVQKGNPCGTFLPFLLIGNGKHIQGNLELRSQSLNPSCHHAVGADKDKSLQLALAWFIQ